MTTGSSLAAVLLIAFTPGFPVEAAKKKPEPAAAVAIIAGTVFRVPGFAVPGAQVTITPELHSSGSVKFKKEKVVCDPRGEFAVRVPPVPMKYTVDVKSEGFQPQSKAVAIEGEQRKEINFELEPVKQ